MTTEKTTVEKMAELLLESSFGDVESSQEDAIRYITEIYNEGVKNAN